MRQLVNWTMGASETDLLDGIAGQREPAGTANLPGVRRRGRGPGVPEQGQAAALVRTAAVGLGSR